MVQRAGLTGTDEKEGFALPLSRFLMAAVGALFVQVPVVLLAKGSPALYVWLQVSLIGCTVTGFLWMTPQRHVWAPPLVYLFGAGVVIMLLSVRGKVGSDSVPLLGSLFGGWSLLATLFVFDVLRRRRAALSNQTWNNLRQRSQK